MAGAGMGVSDWALSEPIDGETAAQAAERLMGRVGASALTGAGYGAGAAGALHLAGRVGSARAAARAERKALEGIGEQAGKPAPGLVAKAYARAASKVTGADEADILRTVSGRAPHRAVLEAPRLIERSTRSLTDDATTVLRGGARLKDLHVGGGREVTMSHLVPRDPALLPLQANQARGALARARATLQDMADDTTAKLTRAPRTSLGLQLDKLATRVDEAIAAGDGVKLNQAVNAIKQAQGRLSMAQLF
jgi:hypothetical protein